MLKEQWPKKIKMAEVLENNVLLEIPEWSQWLLQAKDKYTNGSPITVMGPAGKTLTII